MSSIKWPKRVVNRSKATIFHEQLPKQGWGPFVKEWYSICSMHYWHNPTCDCCQAGAWENVYIRWLDHQIHDYCYPMWFWWHNRKNSKSRRVLQKFFPNLR